MPSRLVSHRAWSRSWLPDAKHEIAHGRAHGRRGLHLLHPLAFRHQSLKNASFARSRTSVSSLPTGCCAPPKAKTHNEFSHHHTSWGLQRSAAQPALRPHWDELSSFDERAADNAVQPCQLIPTPVRAVSIAPITPLEIFRPPTWGNNRLPS